MTQRLSGMELGTWSRRLCALALTVAALPALAREQEAIPSELLSYGFVRSVVGDLTIVQQFTGEQVPGQKHQPVLTGDRLRVHSEARAEILLPDRNLLRLEGDSELVLEQLAYSADASDQITLLRIERGLAQVVVTSQFLGQEPPRIDTPNARLYLRGAGTFLIEAGEGPATRVIVREGSVEALTERGSSLLQAGEEFLVEGEELARTSLVAASHRGEFEIWADGLETYEAESEHLDRDLAPAAASMDGQGTWLEIEGESAWKPRVESEWAPYRNGSWSYSPSGLTWVSRESWGWVPYHYGYWDFTPRWGWVWRPGNLYSPAWVSWYWGPAYVGWIPTGRYPGYYPAPYPGHARFGAWSRYGLYGWAGGRWSSLDHWTFCPTPYFGSRYRTGGRPGDLPGGGRGNGARGATDIQAPLVPGLLTTDTSGVTPDVWSDPPAAMAALLAARAGRGHSSNSKDSPTILASIPGETMNTALLGVAVDGLDRDGSVPGESWRDRGTQASWPADSGLLRGGVWDRYPAAQRLAAQRAATRRYGASSPSDTATRRISWPRYEARPIAPGTLERARIRAGTTGRTRVYRPTAHRPSSAGVRSTSGARASGTRGASSARPSARPRTSRSSSARTPASRSGSSRPSTVRPRTHSRPRANQGRPPSR